MLWLRLDSVDLRRIRRSGHAFEESSVKHRWWLFAASQLLQVASTLSRVWSCLSSSSHSTSSCTPNTTQSRRMQSCEAGKSHLSAILRSSVTNISTSSPSLCFWVNRRYLSAVVLALGMQYSSNFLCNLMMFRCT